MEETVDAPPIDRVAIEKLVGTKVKDLSLYQRAFTHKSALKKYRNLDKCYETLEFIGDSVLGFIITKYLFDRYEDKQEGFLTKARTKLVRGTTLSEISKHLELHTWVLMDDKGMRNNWNTNSNILEDVFEALVGAIYLDIGMIHAKNFVLSVFENVDISLVDDNYKDQLMRWCQANRVTLPDYRVKGQYNGTFHIEVFIQDEPHGSGFGKTKKEAEQNAAQIALKTTERFSK